VIDHDISKSALSVKMLGMAPQSVSSRRFGFSSNSEVTNKTKLLNHDTTGSNYVDSFIIEAEIEVKQHFANYSSFPTANKELQVLFTDTVQI